MVIQKVSKRKLKFWARQIELWHIIIFVLSIFSLVTILGFPKYRIYGAIYLALVYLIEEFYGFCPLTRLENILLRHAGMKMKKRKFMPRFFERYFHIKIPEWLAGFAMLLFFILSIVIITMEVCGC